jgi:hypothetical protein
MDRTKVIFDWIFGIDNDPANPYHLAYVASPDVGLSDETIRTKLAPKYTTMKQVWMFMNQNHDLYTASKLIAGAMQLGNHSRDDALKESYGAT